MNSLPSSSRNYLCNFLQIISFTIPSFYLLSEGIRLEILDSTHPIISSNEILLGRMNEKKGKSWAVQVAAGWGSSQCSCLMILDLSLGSWTWYMQAHKGLCSQRPRPWFDAVLPPFGVSQVTQW